MNSNAQPTAAGVPPQTMPPGQMQSDTSTERENSSSLPETPRPLSEADKLKAVSALLSGERPQPVAEAPASPSTEGEGEETVAETPQKGQTPRDVKALAEALGITPKQLYSELQIDVGEETPLTLGQLKDRVKTQQTAVREGAEREARLTEREASLNREQQLMALVASDLRGKLRPEVAQALEQHQAQREQRERAMMARAMPEIVGSAASLQKFTDDVAEMLGEYGFKPQELVITDHRMALVLREMLRLRNFVRQAAGIEKAKPAPRTAGPSGKPVQGQNKTQMMQRAKSGTESDKLKAVSALLKG